jgi:curved DNA-binding protein CbpA
MDPFKVLGLKYDATPTEIKESYFNKAKEFHP